jgi:hypothetical protein
MTTPSIYGLANRRVTASVGATALDAPPVGADLPVQGPSQVGVLTPVTTVVPDFSSVPKVVMTSATSYLPFVGVGFASAIGTAIFAYVMRKRAQHQKAAGSLGGDGHVLHIVLRDERTQSGPGVAELELKR